MKQESSFYLKKLRIQLLIPLYTTIGLQLLYWLSAFVLLGTFLIPLALAMVLGIEIRDFPLRDFGLLELYFKQLFELGEFFIDPLLFLDYFNDSDNTINNASEFKSSLSFFSFWLVNSFVILLSEAWVSRNYNSFVSKNESDQEN